jgi:hypothetical protein
MWTMEKTTAPLKIAETVALAVMSTVVKFQVGKIRPRRPTSPLLGHFRPFLANRIRSADGSIWQNTNSCTSALSNVLTHNIFNF